MIEWLNIENLVLVEKAKIAFGPRLNIFTGETGAGKSAILAAIRLVLGDRADTQLIRIGSDMAVVEASLRIPCGASMISLPPFPEPIVIRRELHRSGKSRAFVEGQLVSLQELKEILGTSIEIIDQGASLHLCSLDAPRELLDAYADIESFAPHFEAMREAEKLLETLLQQQKTQLLKRAQIEEDLAAIESVDFKESEEELLAEEHALLTHAQELMEKISTLVFFLSEGSNPVLFSLKRQIYQFEALLEAVPQLQEAISLLKNGALELEEGSRMLVSYADRLELDPARLASVEKRIGEIEALKRRFGPSLLYKKNELKRELDAIASLDEKIEEARHFSAKAREKAELRANQITNMRRQAALIFSEAVQKELKSLNLISARFAIDLGLKPMSANGLDEVRFLFTANPGASFTTLDKCASGGEISRLLFAIKTALADKDKNTCLIFDEIDSNVGGETAALIGEKLKQMSHTRQLICITHFVQVARRAIDHFLVEKQTSATGVFTTIAKLLEPTRQKEFARMTGEQKKSL